MFMIADPLRDWPMYTMSGPESWVLTWYGLFFAYRSVAILTLVESSDSE